MKATTKTVPRNHQRECDVTLIHKNTIPAPAVIWLFNALVKFITTVVDFA